MNPKKLDERRRKLELDEANSKIWNPKTKPGYNKEFHLPKHLQDILHEPMYDIKEIITQNKGAFNDTEDKAVRGQLLYEINKATSLKEHLHMNADFYRRQRILDNGGKYPKNPEKDISEHQFMRFWMGKLDYR